MTAQMSIAGPASLIAAVPYLLGFQPADSLVLVALRHGQLIVTARVDLVDLDDPTQLPDLMEVMATKAAATEVVALTYGPRGTAEHAGNLSPTQPARTASSCASTSESLTGGTGR